MLSTDLGHFKGSSTRLIINQGLTSLCVALSLMTLIPLFSIVYFILWHGLPHLTWSVFTMLPPEALDTEGGIGNALVGTGIMVSLALAMAAPLGILSAIYTAEYSPSASIAKLMRFAANLLTGIPSIICGVFAYAVLVVPMGGPSALAGALALSVLAIPTIFVTAEQALLGVPRAFREASYGLGATRFQTIFRTVLPEALPAIMTGLMLAMARAAGETAPLIYAAGDNSHWSFDLVQTFQDISKAKLHDVINDTTTGFHEPIASLSVLINNFAPSNFPLQRDMAWTASLVLIALVTLANVTSQLVFSKRR